MSNKRILSVLIIAMMLISSIPVFSFAENAEDLSDIALSEPETETAVSDDDISEEDMLQQYIDKYVSDATGKSAESDGIKLKARSATRRSRLSGNNAVMYDEIYASATDIAAGERSSAIIYIPISSIVGDDLTVTADELGLTVLIESGSVTDEARTAIYSYIGCDISLINQSLLTDHPYEFYWYDKTFGVSKSYYNWKCTVKSSKAVFSSSTKIAVRMYVSADYSQSGEEGTFETDTSKTCLASYSAAKIADIINDNAGRGDYRKLKTYKDIICNLVSYDNTASSTDYGDSFQLISVFDNDPDTNVVCEGYAKAFQYLCDNTDFSSDDIECHTVTGKMNGLGHMWNVVHMQNGCNYLTDVTNCDTGLRGYPYKLFMSGYASGTIEGYTVNNIVYVYSDNALKLFDEEDLTLSDTSYASVISEGWNDPVYEEFEEEGVTYVTASRTRTDETLTETEVQPAVETVILPPHCDSEGTGAYIATFDNDAFDDYESTTAERYTIPATGHTWDKGVVTTAATDYKSGVKTYTCLDCGETMTEAIPQKAVVDLPAVTIYKPKSYSKKILTVRWKKLTASKRKKVKYIQIQYSRSKSFTSSDTKTVKAKKTKTYKKIKKLKSKKYYYVRVRSYRVVNGVKHVSKWSKIRKIKIK